VISNRWLDQRTPHWSHLEQLLDKAAHRGLSTLSRFELQDLGLLYRQVAADLATVREDPSAVRVAASLNQLLTRAHHTIYSAERPSGLAPLRFLRRTFPAAVRRHWPHCLAAVVIFLLGSLIGAALVAENPDVTSELLSPEMVRTIERHEMWTHSIVAIKPLASTQIMTNNMTVAFMTFAAGVTGGIGTAYFLFFNGVLIGVIGLACARAGMSLDLWSFVAPHGVLELPAIFIAGAAGLRLAQGLLFPGFLPRRESLAFAGREALDLVLGCVPILVIAGLIEAFVSPTDLAVTLKFLLAGALFVLFGRYLQSGAGARDRGRAPIAR
jgi:uncharacterized membrane protein SpoIIM required for sporulation